METKREIDSLLLEDQRPEFIKKTEVGNGKFKYDDQEYSYTVLSKDLEPRLPGFLGFSNDHLFISEEVPEKYREFELTHELIEFTELKGEKGRCVTALKRELELVPDEIKKDYIKYRKRFFSGLVDYYKESKDEEFKEEIVGSLAYLESIDKE